jgi:hypothetical protein
MESAIWLSTLIIRRKPRLASYSRNLERSGVVDALAGSLMLYDYQIIISISSRDRRRRISYEHVFSAAPIIKSASDILQSVPTSRVIISLRKTVDESLNQLQSYKQK